MIRYEGKRTDSGAVVRVDGQPLDLRLDISNHSPTGFEWGYGGSGPAQLALAILAHHFRDQEIARSPDVELKPVLSDADERAARSAPNSYRCDLCKRPGFKHDEHSDRHLCTDHLALMLHQDFKRAAIANIDGDDFTLTSEQVDAHVSKIEAHREDEPSPALW